MNTAAVLAALLTSIWVWKDWRIAQPRSTTETRVATDKYYEQKKIVDPSLPVNPLNVLEKRPHGRSMNSKTPTFIAQRISDLLRLSIGQPNRTALRVTWSTDLLRTSLDMWESERIVIAISDRMTFMESGIADAVSFSTYEGGVLTITTGFLLQGELDLPSWQPLHAYLQVIPIDPTVDFATN